MLLILNLFSTSQKLDDDNIADCNLKKPEGKGVQLFHVFNAFLLMHCYPLALLFLFREKEGIVLFCYY